MFSKEWKKKKQIPLVYLFVQKSSFLGRLIRNKVMDETKNAWEQFGYNSVKLCTLNCSFSPFNSTFAAVYLNSPN